MSARRLCAADQSHLVIVDVQIRLLAAMAELDRAAMVKSAEALLLAAQVLEVPVTYTEQYPKGLGPTVPAILERLPAISRRFEKTAFSCCDADGFLKSLKAMGCGQVVLLGQEAHVCVLQTAFGLLDEGFQVFVVEDAVCCRAQGHKQNALARMREAGVVVTNLESVLFEWLRDAAHPEFKAVSELIR